MKLPEEIQFMANARMAQKSTDARMDGKVCVVTGATSGVGYQAARRLAMGGAHLVLVCRNIEKGTIVQKELTRAHGVQVDLIQADFSRFGDVRTAASAILKAYPRLDVLINNAGIHNTTRVLSESGIEMVFHVNHLSSFLFTRLLLARILESAPARIIQVNSEGHRFNGLRLDDLNWDKRRYSGLKGYGASKIAQLLTIWEFADQLKGSGVTINAAHPGEVRSNIGMNNGWLYKWHKKLMIGPFLKDSQISGNAIYYLAAAPEMADISGRFFHLTIDEKPASHALDRSVGKQIWRISEELTGLAKVEKKNNRTIEVAVTVNEGYTE
jgi:NAD(P)-dependent dehydrogenase (short-subunit alcohol dehydrogenase family)